jgi:transmembrane sensor
VDEPRLISEETTPPSFVFSEQTIEAVISTLRTAYGVEIVVVSPDLRQCHFTGDLTGLSMYEQLNFITGSVGAHYETRGATIFLRGTGCQ